METLSTKSMNTSVTNTTGIFLRDEFEEPKTWLDEIASADLNKLYFSLVIKVCFETVQGLVK